MYPYLVADIGGTNARFAVVTGESTSEGNGESASRYQMKHITKLNGSDYPSFSAALQTYLEQVSIECPQYACVAIAGPIDKGDSVKMTNLSWEFSRKALMAEFKLNRLELLNDFAAVAVAASELYAPQLQSIKGGESQRDGNKAVLGPGTGLGVAGLIRVNGDWKPIPSEGGHVNIAPATPLECELISAGMARCGHVSAETFISGPGLVNLYQALADVRGEKAVFTQPQEISSAAVDNSDSLSRESLSLFCSFLGNLSGNLALTYGAKGGVYLSGGILPRFTDFICSSDFIQRFSSKGIMSDYLKHIPVNLISYEHCAFLGAAAWLDQRVGQR